MAGFLLPTVNFYYSHNFPIFSGEIIEYSSKTLKSFRYPSRFYRKVFDMQPNGRRGDSQKLPKCFTYSCGVSSLLDKV